MTAIQKLLSVVAAALIAIIGGNAMQTDVQPKPAPSFESQEWPTAAPYTPTADNFERYDDGRRPSAEALIGTNEVSWKPTATAAPCLTCPQVRPTNYTYSSSYTPPPTQVYPAGYVPPQRVYYYSAPVSNGDCDCENCNCAGARFPLARAAARGTVRLVTAPFRLIRAIRARRCGC